MPPRLLLTFSMVAFHVCAPLGALPVQNIVTSTLGFIFNNTDVASMALNMHSFLPRPHESIATSMNDYEDSSQHHQHSSQNSLRLHDSWRALRDRAVVLGQYPFVAFITSSVMDGTTMYCGGAIVSSIFVVTSAQCVYKATSIEVSGGSLQPGEGQISNGWPIIHPGFRRLSLINDVAMIRLLKGFIYGTTLLPVRLPRSSSQISEHAINEYAVNVFGWPVADDGSRSLLNQVVMTHLSRASCNIKMREVWTEYTTTHSCVDTDFLTKTLCVGDRGSPVTLTLNNDADPSLIGILSDYYPCPSDYPFAFTRISPYIRWIKAVMSE